jgi:hypothetical protein
MCWAVWLALAIPASAGAQCVVEGSTLFIAGAEVRVRGQEPFTVDIEGDVRVRASIPEGTSRSIAARILGPIQLDAQLEPHQIPFTFREPLDVRGVWRVMVGVPHWSVRRVVRRGDRLMLDIDDREVRITRVPVACDELDVGFHPQFHPFPTNGPAQAMWVPSIARLDVFRAPGASPLRIVPRDPSELVLDELDRHGDWVRIQHSFDDGSLLTGWVRRATLRPYVPRDMIGSAFPVGPLRLCGQGRGGDVFYGRAWVTNGASIYASPNGVAWASAHFEEPAMVRWARGERWAALTHMPGVRIRDCRDHAWVRVEDLGF